MGCFSRDGKRAAATSVNENMYLKSVQEEQAWAYIVPRQAKPIFISKVRAMLHFFKGKLKVKEFLQEINMFCSGTRRGLSYNFLQMMEQET